MKRAIERIGITLLLASGLFAAQSEVADAAMEGNTAAVRALLGKKAEVNAPQVDGATALHWAVQANNLEMIEMLLGAGAAVSAASKSGATPMQLAAMNGHAAIIERLIRAGADPNAPLSQTGDTALMMAISERHSDVAKVLVERGADLNAKSNFVPSASGRGFEGTAPVAPKPDQAIEEFASGWMTPLMFAAREDDLESARLLVQAGADVNAVGGDGKDALGLALFNGSYDVASLLLDSHANVNHADAQRFTPLFWAVDRRNMETAPNFPWMVTTDPLPLIKKLLDAGANPNALVNNTPRARMREGSPRIVFATALMRAAFAGDLELVKLLLAHGADPHIQSSDRETTLMAACGLAFINGYHRQRPSAERLEVVKLLADLGEDVNHADGYGITPLMAAANLGDINIVRYLIDKGADLGAHDLGKKNDGNFGSSVEPLMPIDYAIGVGTFVPNNAVIMHEDVVKLMSELMRQRGIKHTTSECTLRGFTCSIANVDPKTATPAEIIKIRKIQRGYQVDGITGGLSVKEPGNDAEEKDASKSSKSKK